MPLTYHVVFDLSLLYQIQFLFSIVIHAFKKVEIIVWCDRILNTTIK